MNYSFLLLRKGGVCLLLMLVLTLFSGWLTPATTLAAYDSRYFPQTGHAVSGKFLDYWNANGGLPVFGYPITDAKNEVDPETGKTFLTQWFERNRFEYHPENTGTKYEVLLGLLGKDLNRTKLTTDFNFVAASPKDGYHFFEETSHNVLPRFYEYWNTTGGLSLYGYPISEPHNEVDPETGKTFLVQWFERARFELHPENTRPYDVLLGLLGKQLRGGSAAPTPVTLPNLFFKDSGNSPSFIQDLWLKGSNGTPDTKLASFVPVGEAVAVDSQYIVYAQAFNGRSETDLKLAQISKGSIAQETVLDSVIWPESLSNQSSSISGFDNLSVSPDKQNLTYTKVNFGASSYPISGGLGYPTELWTAALNGATPAKKLANSKDGQVIGPISWNNDSNLLTFNYVGNSGRDPIGINVWLVNSDGSDLKQLFTDANLTAIDHEDYEEATVTKINWVSNTQFNFTVLQYMEQSAQSSSWSYNISTSTLTSLSHT